MVDVVSTPGSNLIFHNTYATTLPAGYLAAIVTAEHDLQAHFTSTNTVTINVTFDLKSISNTFSAYNNFQETTVSYALYRKALSDRATTADDLAAIATLPTTDPSSGAGFRLPTAYARMLGLTTTAPAIDDTVTLNSNFNWAYSQDAVGALEHEISEGVMGRNGSLGIKEAPYWKPMDLFRYSGASQRDYTGGKDGKPTYFSVNGVDLLLPFHNSVNTAGVFDKLDFSDWDKTAGDAFGPGGPSSPGVVSATDLRVLDVLGWTPRAGTIATDDYANSRTDTTHPFGLVAVGGTAGGTIDSRGDKDWFKVTLVAGVSYTIDLTSPAFLRPEVVLYDAGGVVVASQTGVIQPDGTVDLGLAYTVKPTQSGTYYIEARSIGDGASGATGAYKISVQQGAADDFKDGLTDIRSHPFGVASVNGGPVHGNLETKGDHDWFKVVLNAGVSYAIALTRDTLVDPYLRLRDAAGAIVKENDDIAQGVNSDSLVTYTPAANGTYYVDAGAYQDASTGTYTVNIIPLPSDDYSSSLTGTSPKFGTIAINGSSTGKIELDGDHDWFKVQLTAGTTYTITQNGDTSTADPLSDPYLRLRDATGFVLAENDDISSADYDSEFVWKAATTGAYYIDAGSAGESGTGRYAVAISAPLTGLAYVQRLDQGIERQFNGASTLTAQQISSFAAGIDAGTTTRDALRLQFIGDVASRSTAALVSYDWNYGNIPSAGGLDFLTNFTRSLPAQGFSDLNVWVNLAATAATQATTTVTKTYGGLSNDAFIDAAYTDIFGSGPSAQGHSVYLSSMDFYSKYVGQTAGLTSSQLAAGTRGCLVGLMLHDAALVVAGTGYARSVSSFYTAVANGIETYGSSLRATYP